MHLKETPWARSLHALLLEVPGWPDAPWGQRLLRLIPIGIPLGLLVGLLAWVYLVIEPQQKRAAAEATALLALETEISELGLRASEAEFQRVREEATKAQEWLLSSDSERGELFKALQGDANRAGWNAEFTAGEILPSPSDEPGVFWRSSGRANLKPFPDNPTPLASLVPLLERFSNANKRIDLIRLNIRADEQGWHQVDVGFHLAHRPQHEKMAQ